MLRGYFLDMYLCLREVARVCRRGARVALVVGNARYDGKALLVDEFTAEIGEHAGLACSEIRASSMARKQRATDGKVRTRGVPRERRHIQ